MALRYREMLDAEPVAWKVVYLGRFDDGSVGECCELFNSESEAERWKRFFDSTTIIPLIPHPKGRS